MYFGPVWWTKVWLYSNTENETSIYNPNAVASDKINVVNNQPMLVVYLVTETTV